MASNRLLEAEVAKEFLGRVVAQAREKGWTSDEHFSVDGTLLDAWARVKSTVESVGATVPTRLRTCPALTSKPGLTVLQILDIGNYICAIVNMVGLCSNTALIHRSA